MKATYFLLLLATFYCQSTQVADSDGKEFVFSFSVYGYFGYSDATTASVIVIPTQNDCNCTFTYVTYIYNTTATFTKLALAHKSNEFTFENEQVITLINYEGDFSIDTALDFRIFASCTEVVKLIGRIADPINGFGDFFVIPSIQNAAKKYILDMPPTTLGPGGHILILPLTTVENAKINIIAYHLGALYSDTTYQFNTNLGAIQRYIDMDTYDSNINFSFEIYSNVPIMLSIVSPFASTVKNAKWDGSNRFYNYISFMPISSGDKTCHKKLTTPDRRMITNDFTSSIYVSPTIYGGKCDEVDTITIYNGTETGVVEEVSNFGATNISFVDQKQVGTSTNGGFMPIFRFVSIFSGQDGSTTFGHSAHYIPSTEEWVTGITYFHTLAAKCKLEVYIKSFDTETTKIDDKDVKKNVKIVRKSMDMFNHKYDQFISEIKGYGTHKIESTGSYIAYVICESVNSIYDAAAYLTAFNKRKSS
uniref:CUB_2 domain-containing protein n=1 Tax=Rhabditophanes sp. KR3021 TaxID=114890 RepID=A0AC35TJD5_9BILA